MKKVKTSPFKFRNFYVIESLIRRNVELNEALELDFEIIPSGIIDENNKEFELTMEAQISSQNDSFEIKIKVAGIFDFKNVIKIENLDNYFYTNAPAIIFPYIRSYISALTALSGYETIYLPPINIGGLKNDLIRNTQRKL